MKNSQCYRRGAEMEKKLIKIKETKKMGVADKESFSKT